MGVGAHTFGRGNSGAPRPEEDRQVGGIHDAIRVEVARTFDEDKTILEAQQRRLKSAHLDSFPVTLRADAGAVQARRIMARLLAEQERAAAPVSRTG